MSKPSILGYMMREFIEQRREAFYAVEDKLWERNQVKESERSSYRVERITGKTKNGEEITSVKLWKLVDEEEVTISGKINVKSERSEVKNEHSSRTPAADHNGSPI